MVLVVLASGLKQGLSGASPPSPRKVQIPTGRHRSRQDGTDPVQTQNGTDTNQPRTAQIPTKRHDPKILTKKYNEFAFEN